MGTNKFMGSGKGESRVQCRNKKQRSGGTKFMCVYKYTSAYHLVIVLCECVCVQRREEKINQEGTSTSNSLLGSCSVFDSKRKYERKRLSLYILPQAGLHLPSVYIQGVGVSILSKDEGTVMGQKEQGCTMRRKELYL